jgi:hypothetical protein
MAVSGRPGQSSAPAVFGDFWRQAARLASPPPYPDPPAGAEQVRHITAAVGRAAAVMHRYAGDIAGGGAGVRNGLWAHAIARGRTVTTLIAGASRQETAEAPMFPADSLAARLDGYAIALTYGRDLLHTHLATTAHGERRALSDWAPVISSAALNRALLAGLADHARAIAGQLTGLRLAAAADSDTVAAWQRLQGTAGQLRELDAAVQAAQWQAPVPLEHRQLLEAIPVNATPAVQAPAADATVSTLCEGIIGTAQRANQARRELAARAAWSPELTADSMRHAAANYVVVSFNAETVYRALAARARQLGYHALVPGLDAAADRADDSRRAWLAVARLWDTMVTDSRAYLSRPAAEAGHLALWTGRLAYADPAWTPARRPSHAVRDPASLAPGPAALAGVASAMHYAADSLARAARTDFDAIRTAAAAGRLYVTTRSLPELKYDVPRPYAQAPRDRVADAFAVYADTADISQAALRSAADIAAAVGAPSRMLSAAEQATAEPVVVPRGRLEQNLLDLGVRDAGMLRRGVELDQMAQRLLAQARRSGLASRQPDAEAAPEPDTADRTAEAVRPAQAASCEPVIHEPKAGPSLKPSRRAGAAEYPSAAAAPGASLGAPEIGDEEPELEL